MFSCHWTLILLGCVCVVCCRYVEKDFAKAGTELKVVVRGKQNNAVVTKMPFVPNTYYKGA